MDRVHAVGFSDQCAPGLVTFLGRLAKLAEFVFGVASDHGFRCGLRVDQYSRPSTRDGSFGLTSFPNARGNLRLRIGPETTDRVRSEERSPLCPCRR